MPPPPEAGRVDVDNVRRVAGEVLLRKGHIERDCLRRVSMIARRPIPDIPIEVAFDKEQVVEEVSSYSESKTVKTVRRTMTPLWVGVSRGVSAAHQTSIITRAWRALSARFTNQISIITNGIQRRDIGVLKPNHGR